MLHSQYFCSLCAKMRMKHFALCATRCESTEENKNKQIQTIMNTNNKNNVWAVETYETPTITTLNIQSEGVLCMSSPDSTIEDATEEDWGTL